MGISLFALPIPMLGGAEEKSSPIRIPSRLHMIRTFSSLKVTQVHIYNFHEKMTLPLERHISFNTIAPREIPQPTPASICYPLARSTVCPTVTFQNIHCPKYKAKKILHVFPHLLPCYQKSIFITTNIQSILF